MSATSLFAQQTPDQSYDLGVNIAVTNSAVYIEIDISNPLTPEINWQALFDATW